ncbi:MAG: LysR family transcriptional regulator [Colwellia sp.]|jgi:DNA-binding transcriptional LysR family regulator|nr:MAG: LysR family transcriptional regulator [Colwellia sp.]
MNLNDIKVFISVIEAESFAGASKVLSMPSTTVSRKVQMLEENLGVKLVHRSTRKLSLTEEGLSYFQLCQQHIVAIEEANDFIMQAQAEPKGKIRITSPLDFAIEYVQPWIVEFLKQYPEISIELDTSDSYVDMVEARIDIAFRSGTLKDSSLIARRIGPKQNVCCASPELLKAKGGIRTPEDLEKHDCLIMGKSLAQNTWQFIKEGKILDVSVTGRYASNSMNLVIKSALNGLGVAYVPIALIKPYLDNGQLTLVLKNYGTPVSNMFIIYQSHRYMAKPIRFFVDHVMEKVTPKPPWAM